MPDPCDEHRAEAERLADAPRGEQEAVIAWHREIAANAKVRKADRELARQRADALERLLFGAKKRPKKK
jgi:hypothetical protein